jgi:hypothetical protein
MRMGGTPHGTIQVKRRGLVVARCGIGAADSFGMKQYPVRLPDQRYRGAGGSAGSA